MTIGFSETYNELYENNDKYYTDVSRSPNCNWDMFQKCRADYMIDFNYYKRYQCVV